LDIPGNEGKSEILTISVLRRLAGGWNLIFGRLIRGLPVALEGGSVGVLELEDIG
jgi:hypothetical protein